MDANQKRRIVVTGATGLQGSAVVRHLLRNGWHVRALTRNPESRQAKALGALGAEVVGCDMEDLASLQTVFEGAYGVYSVQNPYISGVDGEVRQGKNVTVAARNAGVQHLVYSSTGTGKMGTGIPSWESKLRVEEFMKSLDVPLTILRPMAFMELMTEKKFYPAMSTWHLMPSLVGSSTTVHWLCVDDLGAIAATAFARPEEFVGKDLKLASDSQSIDACRAIYREVVGKNPPRFPLPIWIFERMGFVGTDLSIMWRWLRAGSLDVDPEATRAIRPEALSVRAWLTSAMAS